MEAAAEGVTPPGAAGGDGPVRDRAEGDEGARDMAGGDATGDGPGGRGANLGPGTAGQGGGKPAGRSGRNLPAAIGVGLVLAGLVLGSLYTVKSLFLVVEAVAVGIGMIELVRAFATRGIKVPLVPVLAGMVAMIGGAYFVGAAALVGAFAVTVFVLMCWRMFQGSDGYVRDVSTSVLTTAWPAFLAAFVGLMLQHDDGSHRVVVFVAVTAFSDIGGYAAGVLFGRHPMAPSISPKKTWEGFTGSAIACMLVGAWLVTWLLGGEIWQGVVIGLVAAVFATVGDLVESVLKRDLGIKDLGTLLPGHGGMMDRLDSMVATLVPVWILLEIFIR